MNLNRLTITQASALLQKKEISSVELTKDCLDEIHQQNNRLNAFITITQDHALKQAKAADKRLATGDQTPLLGIPIALKDLYVTKDTLTTAGSKVLENYIPQYDATVVAKLKNAGAVLIGKTNCDAWAHGSSGENSDFGPTRNPYNTDFVPGGSSSGSAAAVAARMCLAATGTDTGGSIRLPASFCNVVGLKPTYGRVSRYGIVAMGSSLDSIGHFTRTVEDCAYFLQITAGRDSMDATTPDVPIPNYLENLEKPIKGVKLGVPKEYFGKGMDSEVTNAMDETVSVFKKLGAEIIEISLPHTEFANAAYYIVMTAEVSSNLARYDGIRYGNDRALFGDEAKRRIMLGTYVLSAGYYDAYYKKAMQVRTLLKQDFDKAWEAVDAVIAPVSPTLPWKLGEKVNDPLKMYLSDILTVTGNLVGLPGISIPAGFSGDLPIGLQILGPHFSEPLLFQLGHAFEQETQYWKKEPELK